MPANPLTLREREEIRYGIAKNENNTEIADRLGRHRCTISREISRNGGRDGYRAFAANDRAAVCRKRPKQRLLERHRGLAAHVVGRLLAKDSPMTISIELDRGLFPEIDATVSHETIYRTIYDNHHHQLFDRDLHRCLHRRRRYRFPRGVRRPHLQTWRDELPRIGDRPPAAGTRSEVGHLEGDLIIGSRSSRSAIITVFDRKSRHLWMEPLRDGQSAPQTLKGLTTLLERIPPQLRHTLTWDQGTEIRLGLELTRTSGIDLFLTDAHAPWQRPTNENGNGLIRRYVGKGTDLSRFTIADLRHIEDRINTMPRRVLDWASAADVYDRAVAMTT